MSRPAAKRRSRKLAALALSLSLITGGALFATFTDSISTEQQDLTTGSGTIELTDGSLRAAIDSSVSDLVPGDSVLRDVVVHNGATYDFAAVSLGVADSETDAPLTSNPEGLQMLIERENGALGSDDWSEIYGYDVPTGDVLADIGGGVLTSGGDTHLRITQLFVGPNDDQSLKGTAAHLTYTFNATQRAAGQQGDINAPALSLASYPTQITTNPEWTNAQLLQFELNFAGNLTDLVSGGHGALPITGTVDGVAISSSNIGVNLRKQSGHIVGTVYSTDSSGNGLPIPAGAHNATFTIALVAGGTTAPFTFTFNGYQAFPGAASVGDLQLTNPAATMVVDDSGYVDYDLEVAVPVGVDTNNGWVSINGGPATNSLLNVIDDTHLRLSGYYLEYNTTYNVLLSYATNGTWTNVVETSFTTPPADQMILQSLDSSCPNAGSYCGVIVSYGAGDLSTFTIDVNGTTYAPYEIALEMNGNPNLHRASLSSFMSAPGTYNVTIRGVKTDSSLTNPVSFVVERS